MREAVFHDALVTDEVLGLCPAGCEVVPVGKRCGLPANGRQETIHRLLEEASRKYATVVRLKGGDPCVFGRGGEELAFLVERGVPWEVIPGVSAGIGGVSSLGLPLTHRDLASSVTLMTGSQALRGDYGGVARPFTADGSQTLVFYMGLHHVSAIAGDLMRQGMDPATYALCARASPARRSGWRRAAGPDRRRGGGRRGGRPGPARGGKRRAFLAGIAGPREEARRDMSDCDLGVFYGVGVGPGDPELMTRKAERVLAAVDWIFLPAGPRGGAGFARRIVEPLGLPPGKFRPVTLAMARDRAADRETYRRAADEIATELGRGKSAAWITEGDPLFFSTFLHLWEELRRRCPEARVEVVPGVTSPSAAAARAGFPTARLDDKVAVVPAAYGVERLAALLEDFNTIFLLKVNGVFGRLLDALASLGRPVRAVYVEQVGTPAERVVEDLESLRGQDLPYFALVILRREGEA